MWNATWYDWPSNIGCCTRCCSSVGTISEPGVRQRLRETSAEGRGHIAALAATAADLPAAIADPHANWVYLRFVPTTAQIAAVHQSKKRAFIAGVTVAGQQPDNWRAASVAGIDAVLTDYPLELCCPAGSHLPSSGSGDSGSAARCPGSIAKWRAGLSSGG